MDSQKDIQSLKKECNLLIDKVMSLQALDQELSEKIRLHRVKIDDFRSRDGMAAKTERMANDCLEADRKTSHEDTLRPGESPKVQETCHEAGEAHVISDIKGEGFSGKAGQKEEDYKEQETRAVLARPEEEALRRQIGLMSDSKEIVVVYEQGTAARTFGQILRTLAFLALLLLVTVVIAIALYYADRKGGFF